jgi:hypothetical protein
MTHTSKRKWHLLGSFAAALAMVAIVLLSLSRITSSVSADSPQPLGEHCVGVSPDIPPDWCGCTWGFVTHEGEIVSGAVVSVTFANGVITTTTSYGEFETEPYYALNAGELGAQVGDPLTVTVSYGGQQQSRVVVASPDSLGEQQVDVPTVLGEHCVGVGPVDESWCGCTWGFVTHGGEIVSGAVVSVTFTGGGVITTTTGYGEFETDPYYAINAGELGAQAGDLLTVTVSYSGQQQSRVVVASPDALGEQQVDVPTVLGEHCVGVGPVNEDWCGCTWGFVTHGGEIVSGAVVSVTFAGGGVVTTTTGYGEFEAEPYYALNAGELGAQVGDSLTVTVSYSGQKQSRVVVANPNALGEQQVDVPTVLSEHCVGVGPVDEDWCGCLWGRVTYNGTAVAGAVITVTFNGASITTATALGEFEDFPYYALSADVLGAQTGDFVTLTAAYNGYAQSYVVQLAPDSLGEQRVDGRLESEGWHIECVDCPKWFEDMTDRSLRLDKDGYPHIAYGGDHLYYAWFDGVIWHYQIVDDSPNVGEYASLALDDAGSPHISYYDSSNYDLKYAHWTDEGWDIQTVDSAGDVGMCTSLAMDSMGNPHISYSNSTDDNLKYARWTGSTWDINTVDSEGLVGYANSLTLDYADRPHISYYEIRGFELYDIKYAYWTGSNWNIQTVDGTVDTTNYRGGDSYSGWSGYTSLRLSNAGHPSISYKSNDGNLKYAYWTGSAWDIQTVDETDLWGDTSLALDSVDDPYIIYIGVDGELKHARRVDNVWDIQTVDSATNLDVSSLAMDSADNSHIVYVDNDKYDLKYAYWTGGAWEVQTLDSSDNVGSDSSIDLDSLGNPHISFYNSTSSDLKYAHWTGSVWEVQVVDSVGIVGRQTSIVVDSLDDPHISYHNGTENALKYARWTGSGWDIQTVDDNIGTATDFFSSLALDSAGHPHISYYDAVGNLQYACWTGSSWDVQTVDSAGVSGDYATSLVLDDADYPHISYLDYAGLKYACWTGSGWDIQTVDDEGVGIHTSLALDGLGHPHIGYYDDTDNSLKYAHWTGSSWDVQTIDNEVRIGLFPSLALDRSDNPHISYHDNNNYDLKYARWTGSIWEIQTVDDTGHVGYNSSLVLDCVDNPRISYYDHTNKDLKYAYCTTTPTNNTPSMEAVTLLPVANMHTAPSNTSISVYYDQPVDPSTISTHTFTIHAMQTGLLTQTYAVDGDTVTLTPPQMFHPGELVQATVTTGTRALSGAQLITPTVWQFRAGVTGGSGVFADSGQTLGISYSHAVETGDLNNDGHLDIIVGNLGQPNKVFWGDGTGSFTDGGQSIGTSDTLDVALGDFNNDRYLDAFIVNYNGQPNKLWINDGSGLLEDSGQSLGSANSYAVATGDVDGDGDLDVVVVNHNSPNNQIWINDGAGVFQSEQSFPTWESIAVALGDVDNDGDLDIVIGNTVGNPNQVWFNDGTGTFTDSGQTLGTSYTFGVDLGDLDNDGDLDLFFANDQKPDEVWLNIGDGIFSLGQSLGNSSGVAVELGDVDDDSDLDALVANWKDEGDTLWLNNGVGSFTPSGQILGNTRSRSVALGDFDEDGDLDAFIGNDVNQPNTVWLNQNPTCHVRLNDNLNAYPSVQAAVDASTDPSDVVKVAGYCAGVEARAGLTQTVYLSKTLTIQGGYTVTNWTTPDPTSNPTTLDAQELGRVFYIEGDINSTIEGINVVNGDASKVGYEFSGGGFYVENTAITIKNCNIQSNFADGYGGGLYITSEYATLHNNSIIDNHAWYGMGGGGYVESGESTWTGNVITGNYAMFGAGVAIEHNTATLNENVIDSNFASDGGGGLYLYRSTVDFDGNTISHNIVYFVNWEEYGGGGISLYNSSATLNNNNIISNSAYYGGGLHFYKSVVALSRDMIEKNTSSYGGGIYSIQGNVWLSNTLVLNNQAEIAGSGLSILGASVNLQHTTISHGLDNSTVYIAHQDDEIRHYSNVGITNSILANADVGIEILGGNTVIIEGILWHNIPITISNTPTANVTIHNNSWGDPAFALDGYHLSADSAAIDRGVPTSVSSDIDGDPRPLGLAPDLGADEVDTEYICYVRLNDTPTYYHTVQAAVDASTHPTDVVKIAGACAGTVYVDKPLTLRGGYTWNNWMTADFDHPAILDAQGASSVLTIIGTEVAIEGIRLTNGSATYGGGLRAKQSAITITHSEIVSNVATYGGGIFADESTLVATNNLFAENRAYMGGALYLLASPTSTLRANTIIDNEATFQAGGIMFDSTGSPTLVNNIIADNQAHRAGGGLTIQQSSPHLLHTTLAQNQGDSGVFVTAGAAPTFANTILVGHTTGLSVTANSEVALAATLWGNDSWANQIDWAGEGTIVTGTLNVWGDPGFENPTRGDYRLTPDSFAINRGVDSGVLDDIEGEARPQGYGYDIGADEAPPSTLILVNEPRMSTYFASTEVQALMADLPPLAAHHYVNGLIVDLGTMPTVTTTLDAWDAAPDNQDLANAASDAIKDVIAVYRETYPSIEYIVLVGDDRIIPHRRVPIYAYSMPEGGWALESSYAWRIADNTMRHAFSQDMTLTDDFYADFSPQTWQTRELYLPDIAIGRLVETPAEIQAIIQAFLDIDGLLVVDNAAVAGYDFVTDASQVVCQYLHTTGIAADCSLIGEEWTAQDFTNLMLNNLVPWGMRLGHGRHTLLPVPAGVEGIEPDRIALSDLLWGTFRVDSGCHAGTNDPGTLDIAQAYVGRGTSYLAGTGWTYGFKETLGLSERLLIYFTFEMLDPDALNSLGQSLVAAKQAYYNTEGRFDHHDEKTLVEFVLYALPMLRVQSTPGTGTPPEPQVPYVSELYVSPELAYRAGAGDIITSSIPPTTAMKLYHISPLVYTAVTNPDGTYYTLFDQYQANDHLPVMPEFSLALRASLGGLRAPLFISGTYTTINSFNPYIEHAVGPYTTTLPEPAFDAPGWWPHPLYTTAGRPGRNMNLMVTPAQLHSAQGAFRLYDNLTFQAFYSESDDVTPPVLEQINTTYDAGSLQVTVVVTDPMGIHRVLLTYDTHVGTWESMDLTWNAVDETWEGTLVAPQNVDFFIQAVDNAGNVVNSANQSDTVPPVISTPVYSSTADIGTPLTVTAFITDGVSPLPTGVLEASLVMSYTGTSTPTVITGTEDGTDGTWTFVIPAQGAERTGQTLRFAVTACDSAAVPNCASDDNSGSFYTVTIESPVLTYSISLAPGINLVSLPLHPEAITITNVLASISGSYEKVYTYDGCNSTEQWAIYDPSKPPFVNTLHTLDETVSFWIRMTTTDTLVITGTVPVPAAIPLCTGLNMPGYPSLQSQPIADALASIDGMYGSVYAYDAQDPAQQWKKYDPTLPPFANTLHEMAPGHGYWIQVNQDCEWNPY